ncbi:hypothetical protein AVEN_41972-1 [Araneus ventricosus]|uniref:Transposable element Tc3 transposase n=1 Tax=Araneus ventricosus TaxID=182803 RepID=A0A4Y2TH99_ARAVE|nr:hypothetical protein AVEN_41972-1 [Araneus ventricosus]
MPHTTIWGVLHNRLHEILQESNSASFTPNDKQRLSSLNKFGSIEEMINYLRKWFFSDESTFHASGKVNKHNCRIWGSENPRNYRELERNSPKVNVWCALSHTEVIGPFFFAETTINSVTYLDMLEMYAVPQMQQHQPDVIFQQDSAPPHWGKIVRDFLDENFPDRWSGRDGPIPWPPRSPDITPLDFFLWRFVKNIVYKTPVPSLDELKRRIVTAIQNVTPQMLENTWREIEFRLDVLRATRGSHVQIH